MSFGARQKTSTFDERRLEAFLSKSGKSLPGNASISVNTGNTSPSSYLGSRSERCFQIKGPSSEVLYSQNFYSGTRNFTPGPASYKVYASYKQVGVEKVKSSTFGSSQRILSNSTSLYNLHPPHVTPGVGSYDVQPSTLNANTRPLPNVFIENHTSDGKKSPIGVGSDSIYKWKKPQRVISTAHHPNKTSSTEEYLSLQLTNARHSLKQLDASMRSDQKGLASCSRKMSKRDYDKARRVLERKVMLLEESSKLIQSEQKCNTKLMDLSGTDDSVAGGWGTRTTTSKSTRVRPGTTPNTPSFSSSELRSFQAPVKYQEAPTYYMSDQQWDFGSTSRCQTRDMNAFDYSTRERELLERHIETNMVVKLGLEKPLSRTRGTSFFGGKEKISSAFGPPKVRSPYAGRHTENILQQQPPPPNYD